MTTETQKFSIEHDGLKIEGIVHGATETLACESHRCEVTITDTQAEPRISKTSIVGSSFLSVLADATAKAAAKMSGHALMEKEGHGIPCRVSMIMMSHLSDIQHMSSSMDINNRCNFVKWLMQKYDNINIEIDADDEWNQFTQTRFYRA